MNKEQLRPAVRPRPRTHVRREVNDTGSPCWVRSVRSPSSESRPFETNQKGSGVSDLQIPLPQWTALPNMSLSAPR